MDFGGGGGGGWGRRRQSAPAWAAVEYVAEGDDLGSGRSGWGRSRLQRGQWRSEAVATVHARRTEEKEPVTRSHLERVRRTDYTYLRMDGRDLAC